MALDMSQFNNEQLTALAKGDYSSLTDAQLQQLSQYHDEQTKQQQANQPPPVNQPGPVQNAIAPVFGAGAAAAGMAAAVPGAAFELAKEHPVAAGALGYAFRKPIEEATNKFLKDPALRAAQSVKDLALKGLQGGARAVSQGATRLGSIAPEALGLQSTAAGSPMMAAAVPATIAAVPGAMMAHDYANFKQQTPQQQQESAQSALAGQSPGQAYY